MNNLLPEFKTFSVSDDRDRAKSKFQNWDLNESTNFSSSGFLHDQCLQEECLAPAKNLVQYAKLPPNVKYLRVPNFFDDISPLSIDARGVTDEAKISANFTEAKKISTTTFKSISPNSTKQSSAEISLKIQSCLPVATDIYVKMNQTSINHTIIEAHQTMSRKIMGDRLKEHSNILNIYLTLTEKATAEMTMRQELRDIVFENDKPIGVQVEVINKRLAITGILPDSQASIHGNLLSGAEIIAINGERVLSIDDFEDKIQSSKRGIRTVINAAIYKGGRQRIDDLYSYNFKEKTKNVTSLLSNILQTGIDTQHQHDIELGSFDPTDEDKDDDQSESCEDGVNFKPTTSEQVEAVSGTARREVSFHENGEMISYPVTKQTVYFDEKSKSNTDGIEHYNTSNESPWNYMTATVDQEAEQIDVPADVSEIFSYRSLVCVPPHLNSKGGWGNPSKIIQFVNLTRYWNLELFHVDENFCLVSRGKIQFGEKKLELTCRNHTWCLLVNSTKLPPSDSADADVQVDNHLDPSNLMVFQPSIEFIDTLEFNFIWCPLASMSLSHRFRNNCGKVDKVNIVRGLKERGTAFTPQPHIILNVCDSCRKINPG